MSKKYTKNCMTLKKTEQLLALVSKTTGCGSISIFCKGILCKFMQ